MTVAMATVMAHWWGQGNSDGPCAWPTAKVRRNGNTVPYGPLWVRRAQPLRKLAQKLLRRGVVTGERVEDWAQRGALDPLEHGIVAWQHMQVRRLPDIRHKPRGAPAHRGRPRGARRQQCDRRRHRPCLATCPTYAALGLSCATGLRSCPAPGTPAHHPAEASPRLSAMRPIWPGIHCSIAFETTTSTGSGGCQSGTSARVNSTCPGTAYSAPPGRSCRRSCRRRGRARSGQRSARVRVSEPGPQPRSTTRAGRIDLDAVDELVERPATLVGEPAVLLRVPAIRARHEVPPLVAAEPAVGRTVRPSRLGAEPLHLVALVVAEAALEPEPLAGSVVSAFPREDVGRGLVEEPPVVADDHGAQPGNPRGRPRVTAASRRRGRWSARRAAARCRRTSG